MCKERTRGSGANFFFKWVAGCQLSRKQNMKTKDLRICCVWVMWAVCVCVRAWTIWVDVSGEGRGHCFTPKKVEHNDLNGITVIFYLQHSPTANKLENIYICINLPFRLQHILHRRSELECLQWTPKKKTGKWLTCVSCVWMIVDKHVQIHAFRGFGSTWRMCVLRTISWIFATTRGKYTQRVRYCKSIKISSLHNL